VKIAILILFCAVAAQGAILSSNLTLGVTQRDGRVEVIETHTDQLGVKYRFVYLSADSNATRTNILIARVPILELDLRVKEIDRTISEALPSTQNYSTKQQLLNEFRERYRVAVGVESGRLAKWLLDRQDAGEWTDVQLANAFSVSAATWTTIKARMVILQTRYNDMLASQGE